MKRSERLSRVEGSTITVDSAPILKAGDVIRIDLAPTLGQRLAGVDSPRRWLLHRRRVGPLVTVAELIEAHTLLAVKPENQKGAP